MASNHRKMSFDDLIAWGEALLADPNVPAQARATIWRELIRIAREAEEEEAERRLRDFVARYSSQKDK